MSEPQPTEKPTTSERPVPAEKRPTPAPRPNPTLNNEEQKAHRPRETRESKR
jgi:hypothetical protein